MTELKISRKEFIEQCIKRGYVSYRDGGKAAVERWCKDHSKEFYTEEDMVLVYRYFYTRKLGDLETSSCKMHYDRSWTKDPM